MTRAFIVAIGIVAMLAPAAASAKQAAQDKQTKQRTAPAGHVACTKYGCFPVAPNCRPQTQLDWRGNPTGYDRIVCRRR